MAEAQSLPSGQGGKGQQVAPPPLQQEPALSDAALPDASVDHFDPKTAGLEYIIGELVNKGSDLAAASKKVHQAVFLSTIEAISGVLGRRAEHAPLFSITYDPENGTQSFEFLDGKRPARKPNTIVYSYTDLFYASIAVEGIVALAEGTTGVGKTYLLEQAEAAFLPEDNRRSIRLNPAMSNVKQPYIRAKVENGVLELNINKQAARQVLALLVDEQNRGDTNAVIETLDGQVSLPTGERTHLGYPIPQLELVAGAGTAKGKKKGKKKQAASSPDALSPEASSSEVSSQQVQVSWDFGKVKKPIIHSAQNPPTAEYSGTTGTDGAVMNRQTKIDFPNIAGNAYTMTKAGQGNHHHDEFRGLFVEALAGHLGLDQDIIQGTYLPQRETGKEKTRADSEYLALHAFSFDPGFTRNRMLRSAIEGADHIIALVGGKKKHGQKRLRIQLDEDLEVSRDLTTGLQTRGYRVDFTYTPSFDETSQQVLAINNVTSAFTEDLVPRDVRKAGSMANALSLINRYKQAISVARRNGSSRLEEYAGLERPLTLKDMSSAYAVVLNDKIAEEGKSPVSVTNQAFADYSSVFREFQKLLYGERTDEFGRDKNQLNIEDANQSIRYTCMTYAVAQVAGDATLTAEEYAARMITALSDVAAKLRTIDTGSDSSKVLISRVNADLAATADFIDEYRKDIKDVFDAVGASGDYTARFSALRDILLFARDDVQVDYTLTRVQRVFGV